MTLNKQRWAELLISAADALNEQTDRLSEIDSKFGDGDHGITIGKIAAVIKGDAKDWGEESIKDFMDGLGTDIMGVNGGSAGPLYGTMLGGMAEALEDEEELDGALLKAMLEASLASMRDITNAKVGDKTMMDALIPAVDAAQEALDDPAAVLLAAAKAAEKGAKASEGFASKFGRAKSYKEQTIGTPDAGAVSTATFFRGLADGL